MDQLDQVAKPLRVVDQLRSIDRLEPLDGYQREVVTAVGRLLADQTDALQITQAIAQVNDALTRRLLTLAESALGSPPCLYAWLALGSQGRGEQVLSSDQDNAVAFDDRPHPGAAEFFARLAGLVVPALARAGLPLCPGGYMATTWCSRVGDLEAMFRGWVGQPEPDALLRAEVFLDVRRVHGDLSIDALEGILLRGGSSGQFLVQMARAAVRFKPPLRLFGRLRAKDSTVDIKRGGTAAIVLLARLYALAAGSSARTTVERLDAGAGAGTLSRAGARDLVESYRFLTGLRLRRQLEQVGAGRSGDNLVLLDQLTAADRRRLGEALRIVRDVQEVTAMRFATHTLA